MLQICIELPIEALDREVRIVLLKHPSKGEGLFLPDRSCAEGVSANIRPGQQVVVD
jgi:hypothetical protein